MNKNAIIVLVIVVILSIALNFYYNYEVNNLLDDYNDTLYMSLEQDINYNILVQKYNTLVDMIYEKDVNHNIIVDKYNTLTSILQDTNQALLDNEYLLQEMGYLNYIDQFHLNNDYNLQTNNCVHQTIAFEKIIESQGYEFTPIRIVTKIEDDGHVLGYIKIYLDPVSGLAMNFGNFVEYYQDEYYLDYEEITEQRMQEIIDINVRIFGHVK